MANKWVDAKSKNNAMPIMTLDAELIDILKKN